MVLEFKTVTQSEDSSTPGGRVESLSSELVMAYMRCCACYDMVQCAGMHDRHNAYIAPDKTETNLQRSNVMTMGSPLKKSISKTKDSWKEPKDEQ